MFQERGWGGRGGLISHFVAESTIACRAGAFSLNPSPLVRHFNWRKWKTKKVMGKSNAIQNTILGSSLVAADAGALTESAGRAPGGGGANLGAGLEFQPTDERGAQEAGVVVSGSPLILRLSEGWKEIFCALF